MNVLITGANGQLGSELQKGLACGYTELGPIPACYAGASVTAADVDVLDISDAAAVHALLAREKFDVIFNCAAMTNVNACESNLETAMKVNAIGARNLAQAARDTGAKLVHVSTDYVFAGNGETPYVEWDVCAPESVYGKSKHLGEQYALAQCPRCFIVRTAWLYGYTGNNFVKTILRLAREKGQLKVVNDQRGNPTNAVDVAHHLLRLAATDEFGIYHCTGKGECSWYDFASKIVEEAGLSCRVEPCTTAEYPTPAKRPAYSSLDRLMLRCTVGDEMRPWQEALHTFMVHYLKNEA